MTPLAGEEYIALFAHTRLRDFLSSMAEDSLDAPEPDAYPEHLRRMSLEAPDGVREALYQRLLLAGLQATASP